MTWRPAQFGYVIKGLYWANGVRKVESKVAAMPRTSDSSTSFNKRWC
ncbi:hypothetical protein [Deinococcus sp. QL22]|nr:hypothetical protein [Deinococcus sp. QL22]UQN09745.1 hypothetical protein M1R55_25065 [Deinococcus sp. QL22]